MTTATNLHFDGNSGELRNKDLPSECGREGSSVLGNHTDRKLEAGYANYSKLVVDLFADSLDLNAEIQS